MLQKLGSGNFLIIAYKKLRQLEMSIMQRIDSLSKEKTFQFSEIKLTQFYGIELDDFAHEVAMLSLWLAEHQMNLEFYKAFGRTSPSLPLQNGGNIVHGNATRLNWVMMCSKIQVRDLILEIPLSPVAGITCFRRNCSAILSCPTVATIMVCSPVSPTKVISTGDTI
jgi:hypothetical protein